jgi:hypothetical protein
LVILFTPLHFSIIIVVGLHCVCVINFF